MRLDIARFFSILALSSTLNTAMIDGSFAYQKPDSSFRKAGHSMNPIDEIMEKQERLLGIKHFGKPEVLFGSFFARMPVSGRYYPENDRIVLTPTFYWKETLQHELGHFYMDKLNESLGEGDWPVYEKYPDGFGKGEKGKKLISEGVASYFLFKAIGNTQTISLEHRNFDEYYNKNGLSAFYDVGYALVKPILDKDVNKGIGYLIKNIPTDEDLKDIIGYREIVLEKLSN